MGRERHRVRLLNKAPVLVALFAVCLCECSYGIYNQKSLVRDQYASLTLTDTAESCTCYSLHPRIYQWPIGHRPPLALIL